MSLSELQKAFQSYLIGSAELSEDLFLKPASGELIERLAIYKDAYYLRLIGNLKLNYAIFQKYLGVARFNQLMVDYLADHPSRFYSIKLVGSLFPQFLLKNYPAEIIWREISELEWKLEEALYATDESAMFLDDLRQFSPQDWPKLIFCLHPSVRFQACFYNIPESWSLLKGDNASTVILTKHPEPVNYILWRKEQDSYFSAVDSNEQYVLNSLQEPKTFENLCELIAENKREEEALSQAIRFLQRWISEGLLVLK